MMLLNRIEYALMNNPVRAWIQRQFEAKKLLAMGGPLQGGVALEVGCGRGVGIDLIFKMFGADRVDAFDLDPCMVRLAQHRSFRHDAKVNVWTGDVTAIPIENEHYDAVFDFGILHHVPNWRDALSEIYRVLKPCGRFFAEEVFGKFINRTPWRQLLDHPREDRFNRMDFEAALSAVGFRLVASTDLRGDFGWFVSDRPARDELRSGELCHGRMAP